MTNIFQKISKFYKDRFYAERFEIMKFIKVASIQIKPSDVVLDAGSSGTNAGQAGKQSVNCEKIAKYILELMETGNYKAPWKV